MKKINLKQKLYNEEIFIMFYFLRIILAVVIAITFFTPWKALSLILFLVTICIGFIDYARYRITFLYTQVDSILNSLADKLLVDLSAVALYLTGGLPLWAMLVFVIKDILLICGGFYTLYKNEYSIFKPTSMSKITLFFQSIAIIAIIFDTLDPVLLWTAVLFTIGNVLFVYFRPEVKIVKKKTELHNFSYKKLLKPADYITLANVLLGLLSIIFAIIGNLLAANIILLIAVVADFLDGKVARLSKSSGEFGKQLDSLADTVSFGVAPTVIGFTLVQSRLAIIAFSLFLICGVLRLAKFNIMEAEGFYIGMPITINGIIIPLVYFFGLPSQYFPYLYLILGILMVAPIQLKKGNK